MSKVRGKKLIEAAEAALVEAGLAEAAAAAPAAAIPKTRTKKAVAAGGDSIQKAPSRKKQFPVIATVTPDGIEGSLQPETRKPLIAHLPIQSREVAIHDNGIRYDPAPPANVEPYDSTVGDYFSHDVAAGACQLEETGAVAAAAAVVSQPAAVAAPAKAAAAAADPVEAYKNAVLLVQFKESAEVKKLPEHTDAACFWCCHPFEGRPVVLPVRDEGEYLQVFGNFCSPECGMSYLFDMRQDSHTRWEQLALLNRVYGDYVGGIVRPAPARSVLKMFGGPMSIEEYRRVIAQRKIRVDVHIPPMVSLLSTMDTKPIDFYDANLTKNVMETVKERLQKAEEVLKLRRTKPLKAWESTLDACINLRVRSVPAQNLSAEGVTA